MNQEYKKIKVNSPCIIDNGYGNASQRVSKIIITGAAMFVQCKVTNESFTIDLESVYHVGRMVNDPTSVTVGYRTANTCTTELYTENHRTCGYHRYDYGTNVFFTALKPAFAVVARKYLASCCKGHVDDPRVIEIVFQ